MTKAKDNSGSSFPIVAIGASAGGLNALNCFIGALPRKFSFAVVFMQHLSAKHRSLLPEILHNRRPDISIVEVSDGLKIVAGKVFLCPPGKEVSMRDGTFYVTSPSRQHVHLPIDEFFASIAEDSGDHAIGVIFSGAGTDGARGIQAIRNAGGSAFVQDPATAEFPGMPLAAISTDRADRVLPPDDIAREILKLYEKVPPPADGEITPYQFDSFSRLTHEKTGQSFDHYKKNIVSRRIKRRMYLRGLSSVQDYLSVIAENDTEAANLAADLLIGVTSFYRDRLAWKALKTSVVRKLAAENKDIPVRVWTPACATGEEAYSIAMMIRHEFRLAGRNREIQVFATDVSDAALEKAREGRYPGSITADVPPHYMKQFFTCSEDGLSVIIAKEVRESVVFAKQNLLTDPPFSRLDLVICRNLLIYLEPEAQEKCIALFHYALKDGGYLFLGNAESPGRKSLLFKSLSHKKCRIYKKMEGEHPARLALTVPFASEQRAPASYLTPYERGESLTELVQQALLDESGPAAVAINQHYEIVYNNGPTNRYLRQPRGEPTQNLLELLPNGLKGRIRGALYRAAQEYRPVILRTVIPDEDRKRHVTLRISKLKEDLFLIVFRQRDGRGAGDSLDAEDHSSEAAAEEDTVRHLESELSATRADLQSTIEQLKSLNEEMHASNEELQAANEELETSREELQSLNEELITVNSQLQAKIEEQEETNNDLNNFLASTNIPTVFLDQQLRVRRYTPALSRLIKLIPGDVGRPISDMSKEYLGPDFISDVESVLEQLTPVRKEVKIGSSCYVRSTLPYRTGDNRIEGVVITYNDVSDLKDAEERTRHLASFPQMNPNPVLEVDSSGKITFSNTATGRILEGLGMDKDDVTVFLPGDMSEIMGNLKKNEESTFYREVKVMDRVFGETIYLSPQFGVARIYGYEITEVKKAEEVKSRLAAIVESADDAIIGKDLEGIITTWNVGAEKLYGYTAREAVGKNISFLIPPGHKDESSKILGRITRGEHVERFETERMRKDGTVIPVSLTFSPIRDAEGRIMGISKIAHDIIARRQAEEALQRSEEQFRTLADSIPNLAWWADGDGYITWYNRRWYEYTGTTPEQMEGWGWQSVHDPEVLPEVLDRWKTSIATGEPFEMEFPLRGANGVFRSFLTRVLPLRDSDGRVLRWFGTNTDISAQKEAEKEIRRSELRYRSYVEVTNQWAWVTDPAGMVVEDIPALRNFTGQTYEEARGAGWAEALHPEDRQHTLEIWKQAVAARSPYETEYRMRRHDGAYRLLLARGVPIFDADGNVVEWVGACTDITERKQAEDALKQSLARFELLTVTAGELLQSAEPQKVVESVCRKVMEYLDCHAFFNFLVDEEAGKLHLNACGGIPEEEAKRIEWLDFGVAVCGCAARDGQQIVAEHIPTTLDERTELVRSYGITAYCCNPLLGPKHKVIGTLSFGTCSRETFTEGELSLMRAVTDQVAVAMIRMRNEADVLKLGEDMAARNVELESVNSELESFIYSISHDLRAPLRSMGGFAKILSEDYCGQLDDQGRDYLSRIRRSSEKMTRLIDDLLNLSRISRQEMQRLQIDITGLAHSIVSELREADPGRTVEVTIADGLTAFADRRLAEIVLSNLLGNAWKFTSKTKRARIEFGVVENPPGEFTAEEDSFIRTSPSGTVFFVKDNGAGFDPDHSEKMFRPFHRLHSDREFDGTGIGLTIVDRIIRRHNGGIFATGEVGKGATVYFTLG